MSSWGDKGYNEVWLNGGNDWIYVHLIKAAQRMAELANRFPKAEGIQRRALNQCARELLLAQSSDWAFLMTMGTAMQYSTKRTKEHIQRFLALYDQINTNAVNEDYLRGLEWRDNIFPELDYSVYCSHHSENILRQA